MNERLGEAQGLSWRIAIVRAVHGSTVDAFSIDELVGEYARMRGTIVIVKHEDGTLKRMSELHLRLDRVGRHRVSKSGSVRDPFARVRNAIFQIKSRSTN